jgi:hypothetical protein
LCRESAAQIVLHLFTHPCAEPASVLLLACHAALAGACCFAQVFVWRGSGRVLVNRKPIDAYFPDLLMRSAALRPLSVTGLMGQIDVLVQVG